MSPEFIKLSNWLDVANLTLEPVPEACKAITPAVELELPTEFTKFDTDPREVEEEEDGLIDRVDEPELLLDEPILLDD
jgi:hypothetical protein